MTNDIIDYENGLLDDEAALALFAELIRTGLVWQLQGHYGRTAAALIQARLISPEGVIL